MQNVNAINRRAFLRGTLVGGAGLGMAAVIAGCANDPRLPLNRLSGCGAFTISSVFFPA